MNRDDAEGDRLLQRLSADPSDSAAWTQLYKQYWPFVFAIAYRRCRGAREIAEDVAQEVFVRLLRTRPFDRLPNTGALRGYLYTTAENTARTQLSRLLSRKESPLPETFEPAAQGSVEELSVIESARQTLSPLDQEILSHVVSGMSLKDVAKATGLSYPNTAVRLHRLRKQLRRLLKNAESA